MPRIDLIARPPLRATAVVLVLVALLAGCGADNPEALLASAKDSLGKNDRNAAIIQLRGALQKNPDLAEARYLLGVSLIDTGDDAGAEKELRRALELRYDQDKVVPALARVLVLQGQFKKVLDEFAATGLKSPEARADLLTTVGRAQMATGKIEDAGMNFAAALMLRPDYPPALIGVARQKAVAGDLPGALATVEAALAKDPALTEGWKLKGELAGADRDRGQAIAAYRKAVESKPNDVAAHFMLISLLTQDGKADEARKQLEAMKRAAPKHPQTLYLQALFAYRDKNYEAARDSVQLMLRAVPDNATALLLGAQIDYQLGAYFKAEAALQTVLQSLPRNRLARRLLVQTYLREGKSAKARDALEALLEAQTDSNTLALAGEVYMHAGDVTKAADYFEKAAALDPKNTGKRTVAAISRVVKGESERGIEELEAVAAEDPGSRADLALVAISVRQRKFDAALAAVDAIAKKEPGKPLPYYLRGGVLRAKGDRAGARKNFDAALAIDPSYFPAAESLAQLDVRENKPDDAKKRLEAAVAKDPKNVQALLDIAGLRARNGGSADEVAALIGRAVAANPTDSTARLTLISHWLNSKEPKKAVAAAQDALTVLPERPEILDAAGRAYFAAGDANQATTTYNKLIQLRPESPAPHLRLAQIQMAATDYNAATESLRKALAITPDSVEARRLQITLGMASGKVNEALAAARWFQTEYPKESLGFLLEGDIHASRKAWGEAAAAYRAGVQQVGSPALAIFLHSALLKGQRVAEADRFSASWLKGHADDIAFRKYLAQTALETKDYASAVNQYKAMLETQPDDPLMLNNLAWAAGQMKDAKALEYAERANKLAPDTPAILDTYGMLLVQKGETARGVEMLQKAVALAPKAAPIRLNLASALVKSGQKDAARKELDAVIKLGGRYASQAEAAKSVLGR